MRERAIPYIQSISSSWRGNERFAFWIVKKLKPKIIVDLGLNMGLSAISFAYGNKGGHTFGIDWLPTENFSQKRAEMESAFHNILNAIRLKCVKNLHLIIGPVPEISKKWNKEIDLLHIDGIYNYEDIKMHYAHWKPFLKKDAVILIHEIAAHPNEIGRFFDELPFYKTHLPYGNGLGIATPNADLYQEIDQGKLRRLF